MKDIEKLTCDAMNYAWGKPASKSLVAKFIGRTEDKGQKYAELWMGTHKKAPSLVQSTGKPLCEEISGDLPFLLKVLSVDKALSIQLHPTKKEAPGLHAAFPQHYPDSNHKPEMAIALTEFEGLCGFKPLIEILENIRNHDELHHDLSPDLFDIIQGKTRLNVENETSFIKKLFTELIQLPSSADKILKKVTGLASLSPSDKLFQRIHSQHPGDRGLVCIYLLNHVILQPGECMFLGANKIHAYFSGDCVECMACSDNVVRAGLTGKFIDVDRLIAMVDCTPGTVASQKLKATHESVTSDGSTVRSFIPPVKDFAVDYIECKFSSVNLPGKASPQIILCTEGEGFIETDMECVKIQSGEVVYLLSDKPIKVNGKLKLFGAYHQ